MKYLILLFSLIILVLSLKDITENIVNMDRYKYYRFGDVISGYMYGTDRELFESYKTQYPNTIASDYIKLTEKLPDKILSICLINNGERIDFNSSDSS